MVLDPRQLQAFLAVVDAGSLGRAAATLHVTQPALSRIIKRLETRLQAPLFERRATGMEMTSFGQALLPYATLLASESAHVVEEIEALRGLDRGILRIGAVASIAVSELPGILVRMLQQWPNLHIKIIEAVEDKLALALSNNEIDVAMAGPIMEDEKIIQVAEHDFHDRYAVIASTSHPLTARKNLSIHDLLDSQWVMPPEGAPPRTQFKNMMDRFGVEEPPVMVETRSPNAIKAMVARAEFLGWLPEPLFAAEKAAGLIAALPVKDMAIERRFFVYRRRRSFISPPLKCFFETMSGAA